MILQLIISLQTDEQAIEGLIVFGILILIVLIGSLLPEKNKVINKSKKNQENNSLDQGRKTEQVVIKPKVKIIEIKKDKEGRKKTCKRCNEEMNLNKFEKKGKDPFGRQKYGSLCKRCKASDARKFRENNYELVRSYENKYRKSKKGKRTIKNYGKKRIIKLREEKKNIEEIFKDEFKSISLSEKIKILENYLFRRLISRTKDSMSKRIARREFLILIDSERVKYYLGCDTKIFIEHLESKFNEEINWSTYKQWEIDHIIPISSAENVDEFNALQHYTNLQPLNKLLNAKKGAKYETSEKISYLEWYFNNIALPDFDKN